MALKNRKKSLCLSFILYLSLATLSLPQNQSKTRYFELENGLKVFLYKKDSLPLLNISAAVNLGSKDETDETSGLAHILEHYILFRGTKTRSREELGNDIRRHGAYFNAHTGRDLITFDISLFPEYSEFALNNQKEILFNLKLTQEEIDAEKEIILEEVAQVKDDPVKYASSLVYQNIYKNHPYHRPIYGRTEVIKNATVEQIEKFYKRFFTTSNCSLAVVGKFQMEEMEKKIRNIFGELKKEEFPLPNFKKAPPLTKTVEIEKQMDVNQAYLVIGMTGPDYNHPDQFSVDVLVQIFGRSVSPMLGYALRGKRNLVYSISMSYLPQKYGGAILIYLTMDPKNLKLARNETIKTLKEARRARYSEGDYLPSEQIYALDHLESAKNQLKLSSFQVKEKGLNIANSLARFMLLSDSSVKGSYSENIDKIKSSDLRKAADKYLGSGKYVIVSIVPRKK